MIIHVYNYTLISKIQETFRDSLLSNAVNLTHLQYGTLLILIHRMFLKFFFLIYFFLEINLKWYFMFFLNMVDTDFVFLIFLLRSSEMVVQKMAQNHLNCQLCFNTYMQKTFSFDVIDILYLYFSFFFLHSFLFLTL